MSARRITLLSLATCLALGLASPSCGIPISWDRGGGSNLALDAWNWNPDQLPSAADDIVLDALAPGDDQIIDVSNPLNMPGEVRRIETAAGSDNYTFDGGTIELFLTEGNALLTRGGSLTVNSAVRFGFGSFGPRFNTIATAPPIVVNGTVAPSDSNDLAVTLELTSRNLSAGPQVTVAGVISDGADPIATLALTAGFALDSANHRGTVRVTGNNTYTGQTIVNGAALEFNSIANADGTASALGAPNDTTNPGSGTIRLGSADTNQPSVPGTLRYLGTGDTTDRVIELNAPGTGGVIESNSTGTPLVFTAPSFLVGAGAKTLTLGGTNTGDNEIQSIIPDAPPSVQAIGAGVGGGSQGLTLEKTGSGTWVLSGANAYAGGTVISDGRLKVTASSLPTAGGVINNGELEFDQTSAATYAGVISGSGDLIKSGDFSFLTLTGPNTYTGDTIITDGSISIGSIANIGVPSPIGEGSTLRLAGNNARLIYNGPAASTDRNIVLETGFQPSVFSNNPLTLSGIVSGTAGLVFDISGFGPIELTGTNTYNAITNIQTQSTLSVPSVTNSGVPGPLGTGNHVNIGRSGTFEVSGAAGTTNRLFTLEPSGTLTQTIRVLSAELVITGSIEDGASNKTLQKEGAGVLTFTGANTYANDTRVEAGTLRVNNTSGSGTGTGDVSVGSMATLGGKGAISGAVSVENGGTLAPGESDGFVGILTVGDITFDNGSTFAVELGGSGVAGIDYDQLAVSNTATINGGTLDVTIDFNITLGNQFELFSFGGAVNGAGFDTFDLPSLNPGLVWNTSNLLSTGILDVVALAPGDFDEDGDVDGADFLKWQRGEVSNPPSASDLADWEANFGTAPPLSASSTAVPEPGAIVLLALALAALVPTHRYSSDLWRLQKKNVPPGVEK